MFQNIYQIIKQRKSYRTYSRQIPEASVMEKLKDATEEGMTEQMLQLFPSMPKLPDIKLIKITGETVPPSTYGVIKGACIYAIMGISGNNSKQLLTASGILFERFILRATELGLATCWLGGTFGKSTFQKAYIKAGGNGNVIIVSPLGYPASNIRFSEKLMRTLVKSTSRKDFDALFKFDDSSNIWETDEAKLIKQQIIEILEAVRLAPSSRNSQPWRGRVYNDNTLVILDINCINPDGKFACIDMGIALCHLFEAATATELSLTPLNVDYKTLNFRFSVTQRTKPVKKTL